MGKFSKTPVTFKKSNQKTNFGRSYVTGDFRQFNPKKFLGDLNKAINYRSSYELRFMHMLEANKLLIGWNYENIKIPYIVKEYDKINKRYIDKRRIYIIDFELIFENQKVLVEIKPLSKSPQNTKQIMENYDVYRNAQKWKAAINWSKINNYQFNVVTEQQLFHNFNK